MRQSRRLAACAERHEASAGSGASVPMTRVCACAPAWAAGSRVRCRGVERAGRRRLPGALEEVILGAHDLVRCWVLGWQWPWARSTQKRSRRPLCTCRTAAWTSWLSRLLLVSLHGGGGGGGGVAKASRAALSQLTRCGLPRLTAAACLLPCRLPAHRAPARPHGLYGDGDEVGEWWGESPRSRVVHAATAQSLLDGEGQPARAVLARQYGRGAPQCVPLAV